MITRHWELVDENVAVIVLLPPLALYKYQSCDLFLLLVPQVTWVPADAYAVPSLTPVTVGMVPDTVYHASPTTMRVPAAVPVRVTATLASSVPDSLLEFAMSSGAAISYPTSVRERIYPPATKAA